METFLIKAAQLILAFAILVIIHEFGHFLFARIFGIRVEKFYIFFNPWLSIAKWRPGKYFAFLGKKKYKNPQAKAEDEAREKGESLPQGKKRRFWSDTEYGIGWLPLGGYCKISGMIDESMDKEQLKRPVQDWEFRSKPAWQRLLVMVAGVLFNFLLAILIYAGITWWWGEAYVPYENTRGMLRYSEVAQKHGFRDGDIPLEADGRRLEGADDMYELSTARRVKLSRDGRDTTVNLPSGFVLELEKGAEKDPRGIAFYSLATPVVVHSITSEKSRAAGLREGDELLAINDTTFRGMQEFMPMLEGRAGKTISLRVARRKGELTDTLTLPITLDGASKIGFQLENDVTKLFDVKTIRYGLFESIPLGITKGAGKMKDYVSSLKYVFTKEGAQSIGGFGAIGSMFPEKWNWFAFWNIAAFLSVALAFMNILPIPALDGGHVFFLLYEVIFRRKPSDKFMERAQMAGMAILLALLLWANGMDIVRFFIK